MTEATNSSSSTTAASSVWSKLKWVGSKVLIGIEYVGETVASVLGLDESRFQYVIDSMEKADWEIAIANENKRRAALPSNQEAPLEPLTMESLREEGILPDRVVEQLDAEYQAIDSGNNNNTMTERDIELGHVEVIVVDPAATSSSTNDSNKSANNVV